MLYNSARKQPPMMRQMLCLLERTRREPAPVKPPPPPPVTAHTRTYEAAVIRQSIENPEQFVVCPETFSPVKRLWHDFETRSNVDIKKVGGYNYAHHPSTRPLMLAYAFDDGPVKVIDFTSPTSAGIPEDLRLALNCPTTQKVAWNATFERLIWDRVFVFRNALAEWYDPMCLARYLTFPGKLADCCKALYMAEGKDDEGKKLIRMFSSPTKSTKARIAKGEPPTYFKDSTTHPEQWQKFLDYCVQDVAAMREATKLLESYDTLPASEHEIWQLDQIINSRGLPIDLVFTTQADRIMREADAATLAKLKELIGVKNPNSAAQIKQWVKDAQNYPMKSLASGIVDSLLADPQDAPAQVIEALKLRAALAGAGPKKLKSIQDSVSTDGRLRGQHVYHGGRTGRFTGRDVQVQNVPKPAKHISKRVDEITEAIRSGTLPPDLDVAEAITGTIRSSFRSREGLFLIADYSMIEVRVLAWLSKCKGMQEIFSTPGGDAYKTFASLMLKKPISEITKDERNMAKPPVLGCGYGMGAERLQAYASDQYGISMSLEEAKAHVDLFRSTYSEIKSFWRGCMGAATMALQNRSETIEYDYLVFDGRDPRCLRIKLPSGRYLTYRDAEITTTQAEWGESTSIKYTSLYKTEFTHGSKLVENITQAAARDVLVEGLRFAERSGVDVVAHVHDEIIGECGSLDDPERRLVLLTKAMEQTPEWAPGLVLVAEGFLSPYYKKG